MHVRQAGVGQEAGEQAGIAERERAGHAGRRHGRAGLGADGVEHEPEPRIALARGPHGDGDPATGAQDALDLAGCRAAGSGANMRPSRQSTTS